MPLLSDQDRAVVSGHPAAIKTPLTIEFLDLAERYRVTGVPKTVVNGTIEMLGALPERVFVRTAVGAPEPPASPA